jgi:hypothetical protein
VLADKQLRPELRLQLLHPGRDIRLHAVELGGGSRDAAELGHRFEYLELYQIYVSQNENYSITIIHFSQ